MTNECLKIIEKLKVLDKIKIIKTDFYSIKNNDNMFEEIVDNRAKFLEFNGEQILYEIGLTKAVNELIEMFEGCNSYEEARDKIIEFGGKDLFSEENGYCITKGTTGHLYTGWCVIYGNNEDKAIYWDVRWY